jgi:hypothetical protein
MKTNVAEFLLGLPNPNAMYADMAKSLGTRCKCTNCQRVVEVDPAECLRRGWPKCCGYTMTLLGKDEK